MKLHNYIKALLGVILISLTLPHSSSAQYHKERGLVRDGNEQFDKRNYRRSLESYKSALKHDSTNYEALYNRANAYHHTMYANPNDTTYQASELNALYDNILADTLLSDRQRAEVYRNYGESLFAEENYEAALNSFRESLRLNPNDQETKYNYVLTKRIVDQKRQSQQNQGGGNSDNNQDQQQNQNQNQNQGGGVNDNQQQNDNQGEGNQDNDNQDKNQDNKGDKGDNNPEDNNDGSDEQKDNNQNSGNDKEEQQNDNNSNQQNDQNNNGDNGDNGDNGQSDAQPEPKELTPEQQRMLDAMQAQEDKTQEKLKEQKRGVIIPGKKNW